MIDRKIEIKRNIIEKFLIIVKNYFRQNKKLVLSSFISIFVLLALVISVIVFVNNKEKNELMRLEMILERYYSNTQEKEKNFQKSIDDLNVLINSSIFGYVNKNGYYIMAGLYLSMNKYNKGKEYLLKFADKSPSSFFAPLALHRAGIASEKLNDINGAFQIFQRLEKEYSNSIISDEIYYDLGRIYQLKGDRFKAREYYNKVILEHPVSIFASKAKKRLLLLGYNTQTEKKSM